MAASDKVPVAPPKPDQSEAPGPPLPLGRRAKILLALLILGVIGDIVAAAVDASHISVLRDLDAGRDVSFERIDDSDSRVGVVAIVVAILFFASVAAFLAWFYRAYGNLVRLGVGELRYKRGWSIGAWFIPILNLFRPKQIANDIWRGSDPDLSAKVGPDWTDRPVTGLLHWWWALWLISGWLSTRGATTDYSAGTLSEQISATQIYLASDVCNAVAGVLAILVVRAITQRQEARREKLS